MAAKSLKIDSLDLDLLNPRIVGATDQRDAMQKIITEQKVKLINLAESIAEKGFSPMDRCLVMRSDVRAGHFIVLEGNRRVLAAKLLKNPALIVDLVMPEGHKKKLQKAAANFDVKNVEPVDCFEVPSRVEGDEWIQQRHTGEDEGRGVVGWSTMASARFKGRYSALQALDFVIAHAELTEAQARLLEGKFPLTTLDRLLATPDVRAAIGLELNNGKLQTYLPPEEAIKPLRRLVIDLAEKTKTVRDVMTKKDQLKYISELKAADRPNLDKRTANLLSVEKISGKDFKEEIKVKPKKVHAPKAGARINVVPKNCKLNVTNAKIAGIYEELRKLLLSTHVHAIGVLLRVFLEMSVDDYLETKAKVKLTFVDTKNNRTLDKKLKDKVKETIAHLVASGAVEKDFKGVISGLNDTLHPFSIDTLHAYIHNRFFTPTDTHLVTGWDNSQRFFEAIWP